MSKLRMFTVFFPLVGVASILCAQELCISNSKPYQSYTECSCTGELVRAWGYQNSGGTATLLSDQLQCGVSPSGACYYFNSGVQVGSCPGVLRMSKSSMSALTGRKVELALSEKSVANSCAAHPETFERWLRNEEERPIAGISE